jgi:H/ACA ribonucleoprotein complex subunit 4
MSSIPAPWTIKRELLTKSEAETDPNYGQKPEDRTYPNLVRFGVINLDKPPGPTSHEVAAWVRRILDVKQAGHGGTLAAFKG